MERIHVPYKIICITSPMKTAQFLKKRSHFLYKPIRYIMILGNTSWVTTSDPQFMA